MTQSLALVDATPASMLKALFYLRGAVATRRDKKAGDQYLDREQAAEYIGLSSFWLQKHHKSEDAPKYVKYGRKAWYRQEDLDDWLARRDSDDRPGAAMGRNKRRGPTAPDLQKIDKLYRETWGIERKLHGPQKSEVSQIEALGIAERLLKSFTPEQRAQLDQLVERICK